jgi:hypothetical protein
VVCGEILCYFARGQSSQQLPIRTIDFADAINFTTKIVETQKNHQDTMTR